MARDVRREEHVLEIAQRTVKEKTGVELELEIELVGEDMELNGKKA